MDEPQDPDDREGQGPDQRSIPEGRGDVLALGVEAVDDGAEDCAAAAVGTATESRRSPARELRDECLSLLLSDR